MTGARCVTGNSPVTARQRVTGRFRHRHGRLACGLLRRLAGCGARARFLQPRPPSSLSLALVCPAGRQIAPSPSPRLAPPAAIAARLPTAGLLRLPCRNIRHKRLPALGALTGRTVLHPHRSATATVPSPLFRPSCPASEPRLCLQPCANFQATTVTRIFEPPAVKTTPRMGCARTKLPYFRIA